MRRRGSLLAEVVFTIAIVAVVFLTVLELYPSSFLTHARARQEVEAGDRAESILELAESCPLSALLPPGGGPRRDWTPEDPGPLAAELRNQTSLQGIVYRPSVEVTRQEVDPRGRTLLVRVRVEVRWSYQRRQHLVEREQWLSDVVR